MMFVTWCPAGASPDPPCPQPRMASSPTSWPSPKSADVVGGIVGEEQVEFVEAVLVGQVPVQRHQLVDGQPIGRQRSSPAEATGGRRPSGYPRPVQSFTTWCAFFGAWLLVAGPIYQAALELAAEELEVERLHEIGRSVPTPRRASRWWWLLPPAHWRLERRRRNAMKQATIDHMAPEDFEDLARFMNKAFGWALVAAGAFCLALKETYELVESHDWPVTVFWVLVVLMAALRDRQRPRPSAPHHSRAHPPPFHQT